MNHSPLVFRPLERAEIPQVWTIDRAEQIDGVYTLRDGDLLLEPARIELRGWPPPASPSRSATGPPRPPTCAGAGGARQSAPFDVS